MVQALQVESSPAQREEATAGGEVSTDPRILRTRELLQQALAKLLLEKDFERISVQDITDAATVNRATFYAHYPDKFALLECLVAAQFNSLLAERGVVFDGTCNSALRGIVLGVCDFLARSLGHSSCPTAERQRQLEPHLEAAVVAVVRRMLLDGLKRHDSSLEPGQVSADLLTPELRAATVSWAVYGAAKEWVRTPERQPSEAMAETVLQLVVPMLHPQG